MPRHLLGIAQLTRNDLDTLLHNAASMIEISSRDLKKVPALRGKTVINLFLEPSTRTRTSFEIAASRLSADAVNLSESGSFVRLGETLLDTARVLESMSPDILVIRHRESGAPHFLAQYLTNTSVVNAGDGMHEHPTQALLDCLTLALHFRGRLTGLTVAIVGDIRHSRVARSTVYAHLLYGNKVRLVGPQTLVPKEFALGVAPGADLEIHHDLASGLAGVDVVMCLRMQPEREVELFVPSLKEYSRRYCVTEDVLARYAPDAVVLHPGPVNRGVEITSDVVDGPRSLIRDQVRNGVAVRMSVLLSMASGNGRAE